MHGEKVGGVSCFVFKRIQTLSEHYKRILVKYRLFYNGKTRFSCQRFVSGNKANVAKILCHMKLLTPVSKRSFSQPQM